MATSANYDMSLAVRSEGYPPVSYAQVSQYVRNMVSQYVRNMVSQYVCNMVVPGGDSGVNQI